MNKDILLDRYATLLVAHGMNVQEGQIVNITAEVIHRELAFRVAREAYRAGASTVILDLTEPRLQRYKLDTVKDEYVNLIPKHISTKFQQILDEGGATMRIIGAEFPLLLASVPPKRVNDERMGFYNAVKSFYQEGLGKSKVHWTVCAAATPAWAARVFPDLTPEQADAALWKSIFSFARVDREDFLAASIEHDNTLHRRARLLNELEIKTLRFTGPGTDLSVTLSERAKFKGGTDKGPSGKPFGPNIPSEECYTTPDCRATSGRVRATRPFLVNGVLVSGLTLEFIDGRIHSFEAKTGADAFREYIDSDPGARFLGEVALVGTDSPVFQSGRIFEEILFDENAACHIAVGSAYKFCLQGGEVMSKEELQAHGCNESSVHTDMMISDENVSVEAILRRGGSVTLIERGVWQGNFK